MANYTITIDTLIKNEFDFGLSEYPIFNEEYRETLNAKILEHFRFREIGFETPHLFKLFLNRELNEIMPFYNKMYNSELLTFEPLKNVDITTETEKTSNANLSGTGSNTATNTAEKTENADMKNVYSDTPQNLLSIGNIANNFYATNADLQDNEVNTNETATSESSNTITSSNDLTENFVNHYFGNNGTFSNSALLIEFRKTFLNIDMLVINDLNKLFLGVY